MRRKKSLLIPAVLAFSLCTGAVVPVLAEETSQTANAADNEQETHTQSATDTSDSPYEKRKSGGTENGMSGQEALFLVERKGACLWERWIQSPRPI